MKADALAGKRDAQKLLAEHFYGRPAQKKEQQTETEYRLLCTFRGNCRHCGMPYVAEPTPEPLDAAA